MILTIVFQFLAPSWSFQAAPFITASRVTRSEASVLRAGTTSLAPDVASIINDPTLIPPFKFSDEAKSFDVCNPANPKSVVASLPIMGATEATEAIQRSEEAFKSWRDGTTGAYRGSLLAKWCSLIRENSQDLATLTTLETGKPLAESFGELNYACTFLDFYAGEASRSTNADGGTVIPTTFVQPGTTVPRGQIMAINQAIGVTALITPWNFPLAMITRKAGPALAAGCTAVIKPSELTPLSAIALQTLAFRAGIPPDVMQLV